MSQNDSQNGSKIIRKGSKNPKIYKKPSQNGSKIIPKRIKKSSKKPCKIGPKTLQKQDQKETKIGSKNGSKTTPKSTSKSIQNRLQKPSQKPLPPRAKKSDTSHAKPPFLGQPVLTLEREARNFGTKNLSYIDIGKFPKVSLSNVDGYKRANKKNATRRFAKRFLL